MASEHEPARKYNQRVGGNQFTSSVQLLDGQVFESQGTFGSKKSAEQSAAEEALKHIKQALTNTKPSTTSVTSSLTNEQSTEKGSRVGENSENVATMSPDSSSVPSTSSTPLKVEEKVAKNTSSPKSNDVPPFALSKSLLNERSQKLHLPPPSYNSFIENGSYCSIVTFNNQSYRSTGFHSQKKEAEKSAAQVALLALEGLSQTPLKPAVEPGSSVSQSETGSTMTSPNTSLKTPQSGLTLSHSQTSTPQVISFKNVIQEYMQQRRSGENPKYSTVLGDNGLFKSTVSFLGKSAESTQGFPTKKEAEQSAAKAALISLGVEDPERFALNSKGRNIDMHVKINSLIKFGRQRKRPRLDDSSTPSKRLKLESDEVVKEIGLINTLTVGEIWKEKGNVALVGNAETSFVLYCTRAANSLQLLNTRTMLNHTLQPGDRIISLDGEIVRSKGMLVLQAERCADIEVPGKPDPVLISCGVVTLHQQNSSNIEVLLKRYLVSQAFVNVKAALAQFFRRALNGDPVSLPIDDLTEHMETWKLDEVVGIATMTAMSIKHLFSTQWKFKDQWSQVLEPPLPRDLVELQKKAEQELSHRNAKGVNITDLENHPWSLPKGNFRHRMLTTGLHIEKPTECAARELNEETGIQLFSADLEASPYIDIPQTDNLNPHKGDVSRYYLYVYKEEPGHNPWQATPEQSFTSPEKQETTSESIAMAINTQPSSTTEIGNTLERPEQDLSSSDNKDIGKKTEIVSDFKQMQPVSLKQLLEEHLTPQKQSTSTKNASTVDQEPTFFVLDDLCTSESTTSSASSPHPSPSQKTSPLNSEFPSVEEQKVTADDSHGNDNEIDRMRVSSDKVMKGAFGDEVKNQGRNDSQDKTADTIQRGRKRKRSMSDDEEEDIPDQPTTPSVDMSSLSSYQSPSVKGATHEECAWFLVEEAVKISPVFAKIYEDQTFIDLLELIKNRPDSKVE